MRLSGYCSVANREVTIDVKPISYSGDLVDARKKNYAGIINCPINEIYDCDARNCSITHRDSN